jgi:hypothetical protein
VRVAYLDFFPSKQKAKNLLIGCAIRRRELRLFKAALRFLAIGLSSQTIRPLRPFACLL